MLSSNTLNEMEVRRIHTLALAICDAYKRIDSNPTSTEYIADQRAKQEEWRREIRYIWNSGYRTFDKPYPDDVVAYMFQGGIVCETCKDNTEADHDPTRVYKSNINPYKQHCWQCDYVVYNGPTGVTLYENPERKSR